MAHKSVLSGPSFTLSANTLSILNQAVVTANKLGTAGVSSANANGQGTGGGKYSLAIVGGGGMYLQVGCCSLCTTNTHCIRVICNMLLQ